MERKRTKRTRVRRERVTAAGRIGLDRVSEKKRRGKRGTTLVRQGKERAERGGGDGSGGGSGDLARRCAGAVGRARESESERKSGGVRGFHEARGAPVDGSTAGRAYRSSCLIVCALLSLHLSTCRRRRLEGERAPTLGGLSHPAAFSIIAVGRVVSARLRVVKAPLVPAFVALLLPWALFFFPSRFWRVPLGSVC